MGQLYLPSLSTQVLLQIWILFKCHMPEKPVLDTLFKDTAQRPGSVGASPGHFSLHCMSSPAFVQ